MSNYTKRLFIDRDKINCASKYTPSKYFQHITNVLFNGIEPFSSSSVHEVQAKSKRFVPIHTWHLQKLESRNDYVQEENCGKSRFKFSCVFNEKLLIEVH